MVFQYVGYNEQGVMVKGKLTASSEEVAVNLLDYAGYRVIQLKQFIPLISWDRLLARMTVIRKSEIILFYRQMALLLESGTSIVAALELLHDQSNNRLFKRILTEAIADLRAGKQISMALGKHPEVFSDMSQHSLRVGEHSGNLEATLRQMADYLEKEQVNSKNLKNALRLPAITAVVALMVSILLITYALPAFANLYKQLGVELPLITRTLMSLSDVLRANGLYFLIAAAFLVGGLVAYMKTPEGRYRLDASTLMIPALGRIIHLNELARCCRSISLLYSSGLPITEIMPMVVQSCGNSVIAKALIEVQKDMVNGEGLARPMARRRVFLPMMTQMVKVGEETGNLDNTLLAVARTYEAEAEDRTRALISMIQPAMTLIIGVVIGLIALSLTSAMYEIYGQGLQQ